MTQLTIAFKTKIKSEVFYGTLFNRIRCYIYRLTDINSNKNCFNFYFFMSFFYNLLFSIIPLIIIFPIIVNYAFIPTQNNINEYIEFNNMMAKFMYIEYICCFLLIFNFFIGLIVADYKISFVYNRWSSFLKYCFRFTNFYKFTSCITLIVLFHVFGKFVSTNWYINFNVLGSNFISNDNIAITQYESWNPGQLVFVSLFIFNIVSIIPNFIFAFKDKKYISNKFSVVGELKKNWKTPFFATLFLILIIFIFSFIILKTETSYYSDWLSQNPGQSIENAPNYSYSPKNYWESIWYCLITITTVGYGQIIPQAPSSRIVAVFLILIGVSYYSFYSVFFVTIYTKFISAKKDNKNLDVQKLKNELISELVKFKVIDEKIYNNFESEKNKLKIYENKKHNNFINLLNKNVNKLSNVNKYYNYKIIDQINNKNSQTLLVSMNKKQIQQFNNCHKYFIISFNPLFLISNINKIVIYDYEYKSAICEFTINNPNLIKIKNKKYIKYNVCYTSMYLEKTLLTIENFHNGNYKYLHAN